MSGDIGHNLREVKVVIPDQGQGPGKEGRTEFVYVNSAFVGSSTSVNVRENRSCVASEPPTSVIREQYWTCSKWSYGQQMLAITVGILLGAVIGLAITLGVTFNKDITDIFHSAGA